MAFDDLIWRLGAAQALTVASAAGAAVSTTVFGTETYAIELAFPGSTSSTGGVRIAVIDVGAAAVARRREHSCRRTGYRISRSRLARGFPRSATMPGRSRSASPS